MKGLRQTSSTYGAKGVAHLQCFTPIILIVCVLWLFSELFVVFMKRSGGGDRKLDRSSFRVLWLTILASVTGGVVLSFQPAGRISGDPMALPIAGIALILCGLILRWIAIISLKQHFTVDVAIARNHRIVRAGPYRYIRHPAYAGTLLSFLGVGIYFVNYLSLIVIFVPICAAFLYRIEVEEKALVEAFGAEYVEYQSVTKRLVPGLY